MERLVRAIPGSLGTKFQDQTVLNFSVVYRGHKLSSSTRSERRAIYLTCPCERTANIWLWPGRGRWTSTQTGRFRLKDEDYDTAFDVFVVGMLGPWDPLNDPLLRKLWIGHCYMEHCCKDRCGDDIGGSSILGVDMHHCVHSTNCMSAIPAN